MKKIFFILFLFFSLSSCFDSKKEETQAIVKVNQNIDTKTGSLGTGEVVSVNEKTTQAEKDFSNELNNLLNTIDENSNDK